ncbi:hypothetical protein ANN_16355 [Periplaneta americana]|uniref:Uncharacterized protein n=1 Tax=Periplaneta americana TaxID=6978 RepID=A0ABQ8SIT3_PERAM|nr:hypothetical protein ANN_16355 [Periplaneta americana]
MAGLCEGGNEPAGFLKVIWLGALIPTKGMMNSDKYVHLLETRIVPQLQKSFPDDRGVFQQDLAPCHTSRKTTEFFNKKNIQLPPCEVRSVIKFLNAQGIALIEIYRQLCQVYGPNVMSKQMVRCSTRSSVMMVGPTALLLGTLNSDVLDRHGMSDVWANPRLEGKRPFWRPRRRWEDNIKMDLREVRYDDRNWINLAQDRNRWRAYVKAAMNLRVL